ncbi:hypothetical protein EJB05_50567 [Eragrostis curvula]|uniref:Uncharacterized protein n=1 Tax=Eragrostis curvula TaxID=38414 RepID=A0A5J9SY00_9POAL|nr:hypothetical protein EJB05_50567 [Eragrostis curvula]
MYILDDKACNPPRVSNQISESMAMRRSLFRRIPGSVFRSPSGNRMGSVDAMPRAVASRFMGSRSQDIHIPKNIAEAEELAAKMQESRKAMWEEIKLLREEFNNALKKANEEGRITKEFLRQERAELERSVDNFGNECVAGAIAFPMLLITWIKFRA